MPLPRGRERASLRVRAGLHRVSLREGGHLLPARRPGPDRHHLLDRRHRHPHHPRRLRLPLQSPLSEAAEEEKGGRAGDLEQEFAFQKRGRAGDGHCVTEFQLETCRGGSRGRRRDPSAAGGAGQGQRGPPRCRPSLGRCRRPRRCPWPCPGVGRAHPGARDGRTDGRRSPGKEPGCLRRGQGTPQPAPPWRPCEDCSAPAPCGFRSCFWTAPAHCGSSPWMALAHFNSCSLWLQLIFTFSSLPHHSGVSAGLCGAQLLARLSHTTFCTHLFEVQCLNGSSSVYCFCPSPVH